MDAKHTRLLWRAFFLVAALEAGAAFVVCLLIGGGHASSWSRLAACGLLGLCLVGAASAFVRPPGHASRNPTVKQILGLGILSVGIATTLFLLRYLDPPHLLPFYERLAPLGLYGGLIASEALVVLIVTRFGMHPDAVSPMKPLFRTTLLLFGALLGLFALIATSGIGVTPDAAYWGETGVPLLGWQFALAVVAAIAVMLLFARSRQTASTDSILVLIIWILAVSIWLSVPVDVLRNSFYAPIRPPTNQPFPNSDAAYYDTMAQSLLIGQPYLAEIPTRPLYVVLLAALHLIFGENYSLIIVGQTLVLALIPVLLFLLGRALYSRQAGVIAALAAIFREWTSLIVSSDTRVSNTKMLLVDLPTLLLLLVACFLVVRWLQRRDIGSAIVAGGAFGLLLLLRTQAVVILPVVILLGGLVLGLRQRSTYLQLGTFTIAVAFVLVPWMLHNFIASGQLTLDAPFQYRIIVSQYQYTGNLNIQNVDLEGKSIPGILLTFAARDPAFVLGFIANHAVATQVGAFMALPFFYPYNGLREPINLYWTTRNGQLSPLNIGLAMVYLGLIALGLESVWRRFRWAGLAPLGFSLAYSLANGIARFSGWRYDLPADWIAYFYAAVGVASLFEVLGALLGQISPATIGRALGVEPQGLALQRAIPALLLFIFIGASPWLAALGASPRYAANSRSGLMSQLLSSAISDFGLTPAQIESFGADPKAEIQIGRTLYPRFFTRHNGLASTHPWPAFAPREFPRLGFILLNGTRHDVVLPVHDIPKGIKHGMDAIVLGCIEEDHLEARLVLVVNSGVVYEAESGLAPCP
ncbi:MAG TPA: glycosyltransferase family 39 protein [Anaerolineales bacterium]